MTKISIIVPVYNTSKYLDKCLDSLLNQTLKDIEVIVINDGSKDDSLKIIKKYKKKYENLILIDQENKGISISRNNALDIATGEYIGFVDSDDYVSYDMYEKLYKNIKDNNSDIVICNYVSFVPNTDKKSNIKINMNGSTNLIDNPSLLYEIDYAPWNKLYKKKLWKDIRFPIKLKYEDINAIIKVFLKAKKISYEDSYLYYYMINVLGQTQTINDRVVDIIPIFEDLVSFCKDYNSDIKTSLKYLCVKKYFEYSQLIINDKNAKLLKAFLEKVYKSLNTNFKNWKYVYIKNGINLKEKVFRIIQCNKILYKIYINGKFR